MHYQASLLFNFKKTIFTRGVIVKRYLIEKSEQRQIKEKYILIITNQTCNYRQPLSFAKNYFFHRLLNKRFQDRELKDTKKYARSLYQESYINRSLSQANEKSLLKSNIISYTCTV